MTWRKKKIRGTPVRPFRHASQRADKLIECGLKTRTPTTLPQGAAQSREKCRITTRSCGALCEKAISKARDGAKASSTKCARCCAISCAIHDRRCRPPTSGTTPKPLNPPLTPFEANWRKALREQSCGAPDPAASGPATYQRSEKPDREAAHHAASLLSSRS